MLWLFNVQPWALRKEVTYTTDQGAVNVLVEKAGKPVTQAACQTVPVSIDFGTLSATSAAVAKQDIEHALIHVSETTGLIFVEAEKGSLIIKIEDTGGQTLGDAIPGYMDLALGQDHYSGGQLRFDPDLWERFNEGQRQKVLLHELGHYLGLGHSTDDSDVMVTHSHIMERTSYSAQETAALHELYPHCNK